MLTTFNEVDLSEVMKLRKKYQEKFVEKHGVKIGIHVAICKKHVQNVLMEMPDVNAMIDGNNIIYNDFVDIFNSDQYSKWTCRATSKECGVTRISRNRIGHKRLSWKGERRYLDT